MTSHYQFCYLRYIDVEQGVRNGENLQLLAPPERSDARSRPARPKQLTLQETTANPAMPLSRPVLSSLQMPDLTPSSVSSTVTNTPQPESEMISNKLWRRSDRRLRRLNTELLEAIDSDDIEDVERLLNTGANPNATCRLGLVSACHAAALKGNETLPLLIKFGAEKLRIDKLGRTPLHLAAYAGNAREVAILLDFPEDIQEKVGSESMSSETEEDVRKLCPLIKELTNVRCDLGEVNLMLPKTWKDNIDHDCKEIRGTIPLFQPGWTPLHIATACARRHCTRLLLAAGSEPNIGDTEGRTPLDVVGYGHYYNQDIDDKHLAEIINMLLEAGGNFNTMRNKINNVDTPLHTAVELESLDVIKLLLDAGASVTCLNRAGLTPLHVCVKKELEEHLQLLANYEYVNADPLLAVVDVKDKEGHTVLQAAVEAAWVPGVCIALEAGADVTSKAEDGETPIHSAAALGNLDVLNEILSVAKQKDSIDYQNKEGYTALFKAVSHGHVECVKQILNEGASMKIMLPGDITVFHIAADYGNYEMLKVLLEYDDAITRELINTLTGGDLLTGYGPIHLAVINNHVDCVELLLSKNADIRLRTTCSPHKASTPLHLAAYRNYIDIAKVLLKFDKTIVHEVNSMGWYPLHTASHHGSRDVITLLLKEGADLSGHTDGPKKFRRTAIDMIINNLSKPTEFMEDVFDYYISSNGQDLQDPNCQVTVDYSILMPTVCEMEQMKVIEALLKTGNRHDQRRLLVHPLVESFLFLKWKALLPFFYTIIGLYGIFLFSLTVFIVSVFFYNDTREETPVWLSPDIWSYIIYGTICLILLQELLYMNVKSSHYFLQLETWVKFGSLGFAIILPYTVLVVHLADADWPRHVATVALLLSWLEMMFLLSRFPNWGYYVLMFGKVASNVLKILLTFTFLVIGFSLSFMIQFRSQIPFETPWAAFVKTIVMMTSEFDYVALFDEEHSKELATSLVIIRIIFLIFVILAAIVLMNLLVGVAVNDINDLEILGNIRRLVKQVEFLSTLDTLVYNRVFSAILPRSVNSKLKNKRKVLNAIILCPCKPRWKYSRALPTRIKDAIFNKAQSQKKQIEDELGLQAFKNKLNEMHEAIISIEKSKQKELESSQFFKVQPGDNLPKAKNRHEEVVTHLNDLDDAVDEIKEQAKTYVEESRTSIETLNVKVDQLSIELEVIKQILSRLESNFNR